MQPLFKLRYTFIAGVITSIIATLAVSALDVGYPYTIISLFTGTFLFSLVAELIRQRGAAEYAWAILAILVIDALILFQPDQLGLNTITGTLVFILTTGPIIFMRLQGLTIIMENLLNNSPIVATLIGFVLQVLTIGVMITWGMLYYKHGEKDSNLKRRWARRALLILLVGVFALGSYGCQSYF